MLSMHDSKNDVGLRTSMGRLMQHARKCHDLGSDREASRHQADIYPPSPPHLGPMTRQIINTWIDTARLNPTTLRRLSITD
jgi:hypothetical protein